MPEPITWTEPFDATRPGAAPPQTVGGLDLVPGMIPDAAVRGLPHRRDLHARSLDGVAVRCWCGCRAASYRDRRRVAPALRRRAPRRARRRGRRAELPARRARLARGRRACRRTSALRDLRAAVEWLRANVGRVRRRSRPHRAHGRVGRLGLHRAPARARTADLPVAGAILQSGAPAGTLDADAAAWVGRAPSSTPPARRRSTTCATRRSTRCSPRRTRPSRRAGQGRHDAVPPVGRRRPAHRARARVARSRAIPLVVGHDRARDGAVPRPGAGAARPTSRCRSSPGRPPTSASPTRRACAPRSACGGDDWSKRSPTSSCTCPTSCWRAGTQARGNPVYRYRFTWEAPVRRACHALDLPFTFGTFDVSTWREFAGADGRPRPPAEALSARMREAWTSFAADRRAVRLRRSARGRRRRRMCPSEPIAATGSTTRSRTAPRSGWETRERVRWHGQGRDRHRREPGHRQGHRARARRRGRDRLRDRAVDHRGRPPAARARSVRPRRRSTPSAPTRAARGIAVALDHRDDDAVEALFDRVLAEHGRLDVLVNNAFIVTDAADVGPAVLGGRPLELGRHDRRRHALRLRRQRVRGARDGARRTPGSSST